MREGVGAAALLGVNPPRSHVVQRLRFAVISNSFSEASAALADSHVRASAAAAHEGVAAEIELLEAELHHRRIVAACLAGLDAAPGTVPARGGASPDDDAEEGGPQPRVAVAASATALEAALLLCDTAAARAATVTPGARHAVACAQALRRLRLAARFEDWAGVRGTCAQARKLGAAPADLPYEPTRSDEEARYAPLPTAAARAEFAAADAEAAAHLVEDALSRALSEGGSAEIAAALAAADAAEAEGPMTLRPETRRLAASARLVLRLRDAAAAGDDAALEAALREAHLGGDAAAAAAGGDGPSAAAPLTVHPLAAPEVQHAADALHERLSTAGLRAALLSGGPRWFEQSPEGEAAPAPPSVWSLAPTGFAADLAGLELAALDAAVTAAAAHALRGPAVRRLLGSARLLVSLRTCALGDDWEGILSRVDDARAAGVWLGSPADLSRPPPAVPTPAAGGADADDALSPECAAEVALLGAVATDRRAERLLRAVISGGGERGAAESAAALAAAINTVVSSE